MAVCRKDRAYKDYTSYRIPAYLHMTFFLHHAFMQITGKRHCARKKSVGMGLHLQYLHALVFFCTLPSLHQVSVVLGSAIPTFLYVSCLFFVVQQYKHKGDCYSCTLLSGARKQISNHRQPFSVSCQTIQKMASTCAWGRV